MKKPILHLICNAHLDPVWQWRWDEGAAEAVTTFGIAARLLREFPDFIFNHNEAILYRWVQELDPRLFGEIQNLVREGRWCISGGWDLQPDVNMPGTEALVRHCAEGRRYFREQFGVTPRVAYNFDSFGHSGGLPQLLVQAGYRMYVHMRPENKDLPIPSDLYRWKGVDGSEIPVYRIPFSAYNTWPGKTIERILAAAEIAVRENRDTPVFWGMGDHGGGAARAELEAIRQFIDQEQRVTVRHSSLEQFYEAIADRIPAAPLVEGDINRVFTGCYTSMSRLKRRMQRNLGELLQTESIRTATWWLHDQPYPEAQLTDAWRDHLFNDFHDILPGSSVEIAEQDALDLYGRSSETHRRLRLGAVSAFARGVPQPLQIPLTVLNANPAAAGLPLECEYMIDHMPRWEGTWHARMFTLDGAEVQVQEEKAEMLLLVDQWRRKIVFAPALPHVGAAHFRIEMHPGTSPRHSATPALTHTMDETHGSITSLAAGRIPNILSGTLMRALVVDDDADSWGMEQWNYRKVAGEFTPVPGTFRTVESGPLRTIHEMRSTYGRSALTVRTIAYAQDPIIEFRIRVVWHEERKRLKLSFPTRLNVPRILCEVPAGAILRAADGEEYTHGRWMVLEGDCDGTPAAFGIVNNGQHGFDCANGEVRLSVLRSAPYCFERSFDLGTAAPKVMDLGVHEARIVITSGTPEDVRSRLPGLADWVAAPPYVLPHYPIGEGVTTRHELLSLTPGSVRLVACKRSWDGKALIVRVQETLGMRTDAMLSCALPSIALPFTCEPFQIRTWRIERDGSSRIVGLISEE
jgi:alpha-mannosidase